MGDDIVSAVAGLARAFEPYPRRAVLDRCPHCGPPVRVDELGLFSLAIKLGNTVGDRNDVKALLPLLLERLVVSEELNPEIVLAKLPQFEWRDWPSDEQRAIDDYLDAVWGALLAEFPPRTGGFTDVSEFLRAIAAAGIVPDRFLDAWDVLVGSAPDRHLALLVHGALFARGGDAVTAWLQRDVVRRRLFHAYERDHSAAWADEFVYAYDLVCLM
ncbi:hypothetical protein AB0N05_07270 [Nocardia sp. NPDC051030]|uniref:hypothetical protein n=1 Tax=Nocardia sp. NPDC051030 TaxID=3155162 RepID=UPI00341B5517